MDAHLEAELADDFAVLARLLWSISTGFQTRSAGRTNGASSWVGELDVVDAEIRPMGRLVFFN